MRTAQSATSIGQSRYQKGMEERAPNMLYMKVGAPWDTARGDPRFQALLRQMNFPG